MKTKDTETRLIQHNETLREKNHIIKPKKGNTERHKTRITLKNYRETRERQKY